LSDIILELDKVHAGYGPIEVLKDVSLQVRKGEVVTLIGCNGAGKTTTLHSISGLVRVRSGRIRFQGQEIQRTPPDQIVRMGLAQVPEGRKIFPRLTVLENLQMGAFIRNDRDGIQEDLEKGFALFPVLKQRQPQLGGTLSGGEQQMLAIARALMSRPKMLLMDEPSMGIAPLLVAKIFEAIRELNREGMTIFLVEQNAHLALRAANYGYVLDVGRIIMRDQAQTLAASDEVRKAYLGVA
jgi:branched-chain amino acid transport system ATP-binding protein